MVLNEAKIAHKIRTMPELAAFPSVELTVKYLEGEESIREQAALFCNASLLIWPHGATMAHTLFLPRVSSHSEGEREAALCNSWPPFAPQRSQLQRSGGVTRPGSLALADRHQPPCALRHAPYPALPPAAGRAGDRDSALGAAGQGQPAGVGAGHTGRLLPGHHPLRRPEQGAQARHVQHGCEQLLASLSCSLCWIYRK